MNRYVYSEGEAIGNHGLRFIAEASPVFYGKSSAPRRAAKFLCSCGQQFETLIESVKMDRTKSCGCLNTLTSSALGKSKRTHGMTGSSIYNTWGAMKGRCYNQSNQDYETYGGRGIKVCTEWKTSFQNFFDDMSETYTEGLSLDRIDVNGDYSKENCRWTTPDVQAWNQRTYKNNSSGKSGVTWNNKGGKWEVRISKQKVDYHFGFYDNVYDAIHAREMAELKLYGKIKNKFKYPADYVEPTLVCFREADSSGNPLE